MVLLEGKKSNLSLFIARTPLVGDVVVCISIPTDCSGCALNKLKSGCSSCCLSGTACNPQYTEETCVCYAQYLVIQNALCGTPQAVSKSKVGLVCCGISENCFSITWKTKGTGSAVRKSLGIVLKNLNPVKLFSVYSQCMRSIGNKPDRECFNHCAGQIASELKNKICCGVIGNIKTAGKEKTLIDGMLDVLVKKTNIVVGEKGKKPTGHTECSCGTKISVVGWKQFITKDYINHKIKGLHVLSDSDGLYISSAQWATLKNKLKDAVEFVKAKYNLGNDLGLILAYSMGSSGSVCCSSIQQMIKSKLSTADAAKAIKLN